MATEISGVDMDDLRPQGFKIHELPKSINISPLRSRRDYYKIGLVTGDMTVGYGDQVLHFQDTVLFFVNPIVPRSVARRSGDTTGYACTFTENFMPAIVKKSPLFHAADHQVIQLNTKQAAFLTAIFQKMLEIQDGNYSYKGQLIGSCIELIIHEALQIQPPQSAVLFQNGATRITHLFMDLLDRQFPIEQPSQSLKLRTPKDFAAGLAIHINYLNRAIKEVTGKPTSMHIAQRIIAEAKALLLYTDWSVSDIAYALGFDYPTYFNNYFKRITGVTPNSLRKV